jgi:hypothetical protein
MSNAPEQDLARDAPHRPWLAALLSFVFPGAGQAYAGRWLPAAVLAIPAITLVVMLVVGWTTNRAAIFDSGTLAALLLLQFGTSTIRGFAITLIIGLLSNVFTAVFVSRTAFELILSRRQTAAQTLSI